MAPVVRNQKGAFQDFFDDMARRGFVRARVDGEVVRLTDKLSLDRQMKHNIEIVVDRIVIKKKDRARLADSVETALREGNGKLVGGPSGLFQFGKLG